MDKVYEQQFRKERRKERNEGEKEEEKEKEEKEEEKEKSTWGYFLKLNLCVGQCGDVGFIKMSFVFFTSLSVVLCRLVPKEFTLL